MKALPRRVMRSELEGAWYSPEADVLRKELEGYLHRAQAAERRDVIGLLLPHAGYRYSGFTAAHGVRAARGRRYRRVVVLGPAHRVALPGFCAVPEAEHVVTPLGETVLDRAFLDRLAQTPEFRVEPRAFLGENSIDMQIPLLQAGLGTFALAPIVVGPLDLEGMRRTAARLRPLLEDDTLVVASTDFTHYGRDYGYVPFRTDIPEKLCALDLGAYARIEDKDVAGFEAYLERTGATVCGRYPVGVLLSLLPEDAEVHRLHYDTSGRMTGDYSMSCSYLAAAVTGCWSAGGAGDETPLTPEEQRRLLALARAAIAYRLRTGRRPTLEALNVSPTPGMRRTLGAFVSLHTAGALRGCIGEIVPRRAVVEAVLDQAVNAAFEDPRFPPLRPGELEQVRIEISALRPPRPVASWRDIEIGRHGIVLEKAGRSAVFLPQVAPEQGWDLETTLGHLSMKAGLPAAAWRQDARFRVFEAEVFGEADL